MEEESSVAWSEDSLDESQPPRPAAPAAEEAAEEEAAPEPATETEAAAQASVAPSMASGEESVAWSEDPLEESQSSMSRRPASPTGATTAGTGPNTTPVPPVATTVEEESSASVAWSEEEEEEESTRPPRATPSPSPTPTPAPMPMEAPPQAPWPAPAAASTVNTTTYENVYCGDLEGKLEITDQGVKFAPYIPPRIPIATPHQFDWKDTTHRELFKEDVKAGISGYFTTLTFYNLKIGILPSKEAKFSWRDAEEYERLQCDLDARGKGAPPPPPDDDFEEMQHDAQRAQEHGSEQEQVHWSDEEDDDVAASVEPGMRQSDPTTERTDDDTYFEGAGAGWSTQDTANIPNSSYYPVNCKREIGRLVLTSKHLQFVPDRHSAPLKTLPWAAFAGKPFFSPYNYPRAQMTIHYHTTRPVNKKVGFEFKDFNELMRLEDDIRDRMRPFKNMPREKVYIPPKTVPPAPPSVTKPRGGGGSVRKPRGFNKAPSSTASVSHTEETTSFSHEGPTITPASAVPLMANTARRVPYHKDEPSRRLLLLFVAYCCIVTLTGLTFSILFGYFFGPRRPKEQYIRTQSPYEIGGNYLGSKPPTLSPTAAPRDQWTSEAITMSRSITEPPQGPTTEQEAAQAQKPPPQQQQQQQQQEQEEPQELGVGSGIGRPVLNRPGSGVTTGNVRGADDLENGSIGGTGGINLGSSGGVDLSNNAGSIRGADFEVSTFLPTMAPPVPTTAAPTSSPITAAPTLAPTTLAPTVQETRSDRTIAELLMEKSPDGGQSLRTPGTPQQAAYLMMKMSGLLDDAPSDQMILQKFALSTLYYAAGGKDWNEGATDWKDLAGSDCNKQHVICDGASQQVIGIEMPHNNMKGNIPPEIGLLDKLTSISFKDNDLEGDIPVEMGNLKSLQSLDLTGNPKLGPVPEEVRVLPRLANIKEDVP